jgi:hypothetical protein
VLTPNASYRRTILASSADSEVKSAESYTRETDCTRSFTCVACSLSRMIFAVSGLLFSGSFR